MDIITSHIPLQKIHHSTFDKQDIEVTVLRLDTIHSIVSGNKVFKLHYFLEEAKRHPQKPILTFGGAYSNHLAATAYACNAISIPCTGIVRGEKADTLSHTLKQCQQYGMKLFFVSRENYTQKNNPDFFDQIQIDPNQYTIIPEGGYHPAGAKGAALIMNTFDKSLFTHIGLAIGTATTFAGLLLNQEKKQQIIGFPVLKNLTDIEDRIKFLTEKSENSFNYKLFSDYHEGGYAKKTTSLIQFMNTLWNEYHLPTDFIYTAKMMHGIFDLIEKKYFSSGSKILLIHTGGLQGNDSLPKNTLLF